MRVDLAAASDFVRAALAVHAQFGDASTVDVEVSGAADSANPLQGAGGESFLRVGT